LVLAKANRCGLVHLLHSKPVNEYNSPYSLRQKTACLYRPFRNAGSYLLRLLENRFESSAIADDPLKRTLGPEPAQGLRLMHDLPQKPQHFGLSTKTASFMNASAACLGRQLHIPAINCDSRGLLTYQMQHGPFQRQVMIERFCEELDCILPHRSDSHPGISVSRE